MVCVPGADDSCVPAAGSGYGKCAPPVRAGTQEPVADDDPDGSSDAGAEAAGADVGARSYADPLVRGGGGT